MSLTATPWDIVQPVPKARPVPEPPPEPVPDPDPLVELKPFTYEQDADPPVIPTSDALPILARSARLVASYQEAVKVLDDVARADMASIVAGKIGRADPGASTTSSGGAACMPKPGCLLPSPSKSSPWCPTLRPCMSWRSYCVSISPITRWVASGSTWTLPAKAANDELAACDREVRAVAESITNEEWCRRQAQGPNIQWVERIAWMRRSELSASTSAPDRRLAFAGRAHDCHRHDQGGRYRAGRFLIHSFRPRFWCDAVVSAANDACKQRPSQRPASRP